MRLSRGKTWPRARTLPLMAAGLMALAAAWASPVVAFASPAADVAAASTPAAKARPRPVMSFPAGEAGLSYVFSRPAYLGRTVEDTPYQSLAICRQGQGCRQVLDLQGEASGVTVSADTGFSPDRLYAIVMRLMQVDKRRKQYGRQTNEHVGAREAAVVRFVTPKGHEAGIGGWSAAHPHALEVWHDLESGHELAWPEHEVPPAP